MSGITLQRDSASGCFRLQSHGVMPTNILRSMYNNDKSLSDVSLTGTALTSGACNLQPIRAHKNILAHASPHLYELFTIQGYVDSNKPAYTFTTINHDSLQSIIEFIYTDNVELEEDGTVERVRGILIGAKYLIMEKLADACETFLSGSDQINVQNCIEVFQFAFKYKCADLLGVVCGFIAENLLAVSQSTKFLDLTQDECAKFLLSEPVVAENADDRWRAAIAWLNHESPSRAGSAECIMTMASLDAAGVRPETLLLAAQSDVIRPTIKGICLTLIDAMAGNIQRISSQLESEQNKTQEKNLEKARGEAWYILGGQNNTKAFYRYDVVGRQWSTLPNLSWKLKSAGVCAIGKRLIVMGGNRCGLPAASIDEYDTVAQTWSTCKTKLSNARTNLAVTADSKYAYVFGGRDYVYKMLNVAERYGTKSKKLQRLTNMDDKRYDATAACKENNVVFVVGGFLPPDEDDADDVNEFWFSTIEKYDHDENEWKTIAKSLKEPRRSPGVAFLGDDLYIAGGCDSKKVEILNTETGKMRFGGELVHTRKGCSAVTLDQHVMCVVGGTGSSAGSTVDVYDNREGKWSVGVIVPNMPSVCSYFGLAHVRP